MIFILRYILILIGKNIAKVIFLVCSIGLYISLNYIDSRAETEYEVMFEFESKGDTYYIYEYDDLEKGWSHVKKDEDFRPGDKEGVMIENHVNAFYVLSIISLVICSLLFLLIPLDSYNGRWNFKDVYAYCLFKDVKLDREGDKLYYHCRGKILKMIDTEENGRLYSDKGLSPYQIEDLLKEFVKSPNLYEKYRGTESDIRNDKIDDIINE